MLSARNLRIPDWWTAAAAKKGQAGMGQTVSFAEAIEGAQQIITYQRVLRCEGCKGNKVKELEDQKPCPRCFGSGEDKDTPGELCKACLGGGLESVICMDCGGDGLID